MVTSSDSEGETGRRIVSLIPLSVSLSLLESLLLYEALIDPVRSIFVLKIKAQLAYRSIIFSKEESRQFDVITSFVQTLATLSK